MVLAVAFVLVPVELGIIVLASRRTRDRGTRSGPLASVRYRTRPRLGRFVGLVLGVGLLGVVLAGAADLLGSTIQQLFHWIPVEYRLYDVTLYEPYSRETLLGTAGISLVVFGIVGPIVEELYFRGYLLPRLPGTAGTAAIVNAGLFGLYHFWQPYAALGVALGFLPISYAVRRTESIWVSIAIHVLTNLHSLGALFYGLLV